jgi:hypothetical protein
MEYDQFSSPIWAFNPPSSHEFLDVEFTLDEPILKAITMDDRTSEDMHNRFLFLLELENLEVECERNPWHEPCKGIYLKKYYA